MLLFLGFARSCWRGIGMMSGLELSVAIIFSLVESVQMIAIIFPATRIFGDGRPGEGHGDITMSI